MSFDFLEKKYFWNPVDFWLAGCYNMSKKGQKSTLEDEDEMNENLQMLSLDDIRNLERRYPRQVKSSVVTNATGYPVAGVAVKRETARSDILVKVDATKSEKRVYFFVIPLATIRRYSQGLKIWFGENRNPEEIEHWQFCKGYR